jgi:D-alanyl-lipoteichoic acid acyltransferase DltB (MBOAT superfamily)
VTFVLIGFWHGACWTFVFFGLYHSLGVISTRFITGAVGHLKGVDRKQIEDELEGRFFPILATNLFIIGSLALFRSPDLQTAGVVYSRLLQWDTLTVLFSASAIVVLAFSIISHYVPERWEEYFRARLGQIHPFLQASVVFLVCVGVLNMADVTQQSFVYFQF